MDKFDAYELFIPQMGYKQIFEDSFLVSVPSYITNKKHNAVRKNLRPKLEVTRKNQSPEKLGKADVSQG